MNFIFEGHERFIKNNRMLIKRLMDYGYMVTHGDLPVSYDDDHNKAIRNAWMQNIKSIQSESVVVEA